MPEVGSGTCTGGTADHFVQYGQYKPIPQNVLDAIQAAAKKASTEAINQFKAEAFNPEYKCEASPCINSGNIEAHDYLPSHTQQIPVQHGKTMSHKEFEDKALLSFCKSEQIVMPEVASLDKTQPVMEFQDDKQLAEYLVEWQTRLFLDDWIIKAVLCDPGELWGDDGRRAGEIEMKFDKKCARIQIERLTEDTRNRIVKICQERVLVHELLHCKYNWVYRADTYEAKVLDTLEHQLLEEMSKSLIMAKYKIDHKWFKNF